MTNEQFLYRDYSKIKYEYKIFKDFVIGKLGYEEAGRLEEMARFTAEQSSETND
jgi:hypothetical protein